MCIASQNLGTGELEGSHFKSWTKLLHMVRISFIKFLENIQHLFHISAGRKLNVYEEVNSIISSDYKVIFLKN